MRLLALLVLVLANLGLRFSTRDLREERAELQAELTARTDALAVGRERARAEASSKALVGRFEDGLSRMESGPVTISLLRESLLEAESGLELDRLSLDFRPLTSGGASIASSGSRIQLSSRGPFHALAAYLGRIEESGLPLAAEELRLRRESDGRVTLDARWTALWDIEGDLSAAQAARVDAWLQTTRDATLHRDLFVEGQRAAVRQSSAPEPGKEMPTVERAPRLELEPAPPGGSVPALAGFVLARPELEPDVDRRILAALRYEGELHLMTVGEDLGDYQLAEMEALQSVTLIYAPTGERVVLYLP